MPQQTMYPGFDRTYEELKQVMGMIEIAKMMSFDRTYEELKHTNIRNIAGYLEPGSFDRTYEELKPARRNHDDHEILQRF